MERVGGVKNEERVLVREEGERSDRLTGDSKLAQIAVQTQSG